MVKRNTRGKKGERSGARQRVRRGTASPGEARGHAKPLSGLARLLQRTLPREYRVAPGQKIGVAVSGGADSVALLRLLLELREPLGIVLSVVHFNHQLRGKASDADETFVAKLAAEHGVPFLMARENVGEQAKQQKANVEETARRMRYAFFGRLGAEDHVGRIAVAHTADDQAETVLSHMLRGTGLPGLGGIHPEAGRVFRPLLKVRRGELRSYLRALGQGWREDATNRDIQRTRARIRRKLIPFLERAFQPAVVEHLCRLADLARQEDAWLESSAELRVFLNAREEKHGWRLRIRELAGRPDRTEIEDIGEAGAGLTPRTHSGQEANLTRSANAKVLTGLPLASAQHQPVPRKEGEMAGVSYERRAAEAMSKRMIRVLLRRVKPRAGQLSAVHVDAVLRLAQQAGGGKTLHLPGGVEVRRERDSLLFRPLEEASNKDRTSRKGFAYEVDLGKEQAELRPLEHSGALRFQVIDWLRQGRETKGTGAVLDRDKLRLPLMVRNWRPGDTLQAVGHQKRHKLSRLLNEVGISRWEKASWPVLTCGGKIAWCRGLPVAAEFAVGESTRTGVVITEVPLG